MARYFTEQEIDGFRDCFYLRCKSGVMTQVDELKFVMRSVGLSPTINELKAYIKQKAHKISFADFLDVAYSHLKTEKISDEILKAFEANSNANNSDGDGLIYVNDLGRLLCTQGEKLTEKEFQNLLKDLNATKTSNISYKQLVNSLIVPRV